MTMIGADVAGLRTLGQAMKSSGDRLRSMQGEIAAALGSSSWSGPDSDGFRSEWTGQLSGRLSTVSAALAEVAGRLDAQAVEQELASGMAPGSGGGPRPSGPTAPTPGEGGGDCVECKYRGVPGSFNQAFGSPGWFATSSAVGAAGIKLDSLLAQGAYKAGAQGGPGLWQLSKMGYPSQAPGWLDEATGKLYASAKFGTQGQLLNAAHGLTRGFSYLGVGTGLLSAYQAWNCGGPDAGYGVADGLISAGFSAMALVPGPVGVAGTVLSIGWGFAQQLCGDRPVTKAIADGASSIWHSIFG